MYAHTIIQSLKICPLTHIGHLFIGKYFVTIPPMSQIGVRKANLFQSFDIYGMSYSNFSTYRLRS